MGRHLTRPALRSAIRAAVTAPTAAYNYGAGTRVDTVYGSKLEAWYLAHANNLTTATGVSVWDDISGNAHHLSQGTGAAQPAFNATAGPDGSGEVQFDGVDDLLRTVDSSFDSKTLV